MEFIKAEQPDSIISCLLKFGITLLIDIDSRGMLYTGMSTNLFKSSVESVERLFEFSLKPFENKTQKGQTF